MTTTTDDSPLLGLTTEGERILGRSRTSIARQALVPGVRSTYALPISLNQALAMMVEVTSDEEGFELRLFDPLWSPLLEWRFEATDHPELEEQCRRTLPSALRILHSLPRIGSTVGAKAEE